MAIIVADVVIAEALQVLLEGSMMGDRVEVVVVVVVLVFLTVVVIVIVILMDNSELLYQ